MAGSYPDPPGVRIEYDKDGSGMVWFNSPTLTPLSVAQMGVMNRESTGTAFRLNIGEFMACMFPTGMTLTAAYTAGNQGGASHAPGSSRCPPTPRPVGMAPGRIWRQLTT